MTERVERLAKSSCRGGNDGPVGFLKEIKMLFATQRRRALRCGEAWLRSGVEIYTATYPKVGKELRSGVRCHAVAY